MATDIRVGVDLAMVDDVAASVERFGDRYLRRVYTDHELACCEGEGSVAAAGLAARFAAKEATIKVLRPVDDAPDWRSIEIQRIEGGAAELRLSGAADELAAAAGITKLSVSMTHEGDVAAAVVVALVDDDERGAR